MDPGRKAWRTHRSGGTESPKLTSSRFRKDPQCPRSRPPGGCKARFRKTASGKFKCWITNKSHILTQESRPSVSATCSTNHVRAEDAGRVDRMLPYL